MEQKGHKLQADFFSPPLILAAESEMSITLGLSCGFESHYKDECPVQQKVGRELDLNLGEKSDY